MIEAFIVKHGVTKCPGAFTPELAALNAQRNADYANMTPEERYKAGLSNYRPKGCKGRRPNPNQTEKQKKAAEYARRYNEKKRIAKLGRSS